MKKPECFYIAQKLRECMKILGFNDDQHDTDIMITAGLTGAGKEHLQSAAGGVRCRCGINRLLNLLVALGLAYPIWWGA